jgi:hypothetical protein
MMEAKGPGIRRFISGFGGLSDYSIFKAPEKDYRRPSTLIVRNTEFSHDVV